MSAPHWLGPYKDASTALNELRKSVAEIIGADPETWPDHGNAPLAIAATLAIARRTHPAPAQEPVAANRIWFDTEFIEDGRTIELLSIGLVRQDGATYYAEPEEADRSRASEWVEKNVIPHLRGPVKPRAVIAREIVEFAGADPEFWAYYADYDWVALCQLFGTMMDLPEGWPMFCRDVQQVRAALGVKKLPPQSSTEHHALADAIWTKEAHAYLSSLYTHPTPAQEPVAETPAGKLASAVLNYYDCAEADHVRQKRFDEMIDLAKAISNSPMAGNDAKSEQLTKERDEARQIVRDIYWMAIRYADGRKTYAVGMLNDALDKAYGGGWLEHTGSVGDYAYARDGASPEYLTAEARQELAEAQRDETAAKLRQAEAQLTLAAVAAGKTAKTAWKPTHRHVKRGSEYRAIGEAEAQVSTGGHMTPTDLTRCRIISDGDRLTVYQGTDGKLWARFTDEFNDGRFVAIEAEA